VKPNRSNGLAVIRVYDAAGNVIETHEHKGEFWARFELGRLSPKEEENSRP
jgi:hypothetical protein